MLDVNSNYKIIIDDLYREKIKSISYHGNLQFIRIPLGPCNAPEPFQHTMKIIVSNKKWQLAFVYINYLVLFSKTSRQNIEHVQFVLPFLKSAGATNKLERKNFYEKHSLLGYRNLPNTIGIQAWNEKCSGGLELTASLTKLRSFLEFCNVFRHFVPIFVRLAPSLKQGLKKNRTGLYALYTSDKLRAMDSFKNALMAPPILVLSTLADPWLSIQTPVTFGKAASFQNSQTKQSNKLSIVSVAERLQETAWQSWRECLGTVWTILLLEQHLQGHWSALRTDYGESRCIHKPSWMHDMSWTMAPRRFQIWH